MRLFGGDIVPDLSVAPDEMRAPWVVPSTLRRAHRERLIGLVTRALLQFDPRLVPIELAWSERALFHEHYAGEIERPLVTWRIEQTVTDGESVLREAAQMVGALHLFDFEGPAPLTSYGWLGPLKLRLLYRIIDVWYDRAKVADPQEMADALTEVAGLVVSPIDLLDAADHVISTRLMGFDLATARDDAIASVIAASFAPEPDDARPADVFVRALGEAARGKALSPASRDVLAESCWLDKELGSTMPILDKLADRAFLLRVAQKVLWRRGPTAPLDTLLPDESAGEPTISNRRSLEVEADRILVALREGRARTFAIEEQRQFASTLEELAGELDDARGDKLEQELVERSAILLDAAGELGQGALSAADAWSRAAQRWMLAGHDEQAERSIERALRVSVNDPRARARAQKVLGDLHLTRGDTTSAKIAYGEALALARAASDKEGEALALSALGDARAKTGDLRGAESAVREALALFQALGDARGEGRAHKALADLHLWRDEPWEAKSAYQSAIALLRAAGDAPDEASAHKALGDLQQTMDDLAGARRSYETALALHRAAKDRQGEALTLEALGRLHRRVGDRAGAKGAYDAAWAIYQATGKTRDEARAREAADALASELSNEHPFLRRVERVAALRNPGATFTRHEAPPPFDGLLEMGPLAELIAALDAPITEELLRTFVADVEPPFREDNPLLRSTVVHMGSRAPDELSARAQRRGVLLEPWDDYQYLIDFSGYLAPQASTMGGLYVERPARVGLAQKHNEERAPDALQTLLDRLRSPGPCVVLVLGDIQVGKTVLLRALARALASQDPPLIPVLIEMNHEDKPRTIRQLLSQHMALSGMDRIDLDAFEFMMGEGRIALLLDGLDTLALRTTYDRAAEQLDWVLGASRGDAKVVITSRRQHFLTDHQAKRALLARVEPSNAYVMTMDPLGEPSIDEHAMNQWLDREHQRQNPRGAPPGIGRAELRSILVNIARWLSERGNHTFTMDELPDSVFGELPVSSHVARHLIGSGSLLTRDAEGNFSFMHPSILTWLLRQQP